MAVQGVLHLGKIKTGLSQATPIAQGRKLKIVCTQHLPMQIDGEPWRQRKGIIEIQSTNRFIYIHIHGYILIIIIDFNIISLLLLLLLLLVSI